MPTSTKALSTNLIAQILSNININIDIDILKGRLTSLCSKSSKELSIYSNTSSVLYYIRMEIQSNNPLWSKQVEFKKIALLYTTNVKKNNIPVKWVIDNSLKVRMQCEISEALALNNMPFPWGESETINNSNIYI